MRGEGNIEGIANFKRDRKKTMSIIASLSLGGIILLVVSSIVLPVSYTHLDVYKSQVLTPALLATFVRTQYPYPLHDDLLLLS